MESVEPRLPAVRSIAWLDALRGSKIPCEKKKPCDESRVPDEHAPAQATVQSLRCRIATDPSRRIKWPPECATLKCEPATKPSSLRRAKGGRVRTAIPLPSISVECMLVAYQTVEEVEARNEHTDECD